MRGDSVLFVQYQRELPDGRIVVSGPTFGGAQFHWTSGNSAEVKLVRPDDPEKVCTTTLSCENPQLLSSAEQHGYDPFSTEYPSLRQLQNYTAAILCVRTRSTSMLGLVMLPAHANPRFLNCRLRVVLSGLEGDALLLEELAQLHGEQENLILRWENPTCTGFLLTPASGFSSGLSVDADVTLIIYHDTMDLCSGDLFCLKPYRQAGTRKTEYHEVHVGTCHPLLQASD